MVRLIDICLRFFGHCFMTACSSGEPEVPMFSLNNCHRRLVSILRKILVMVLAIFFVLVWSVRKLCYSSVGNWKNILKNRLICSSLRVVSMWVLK